MSEPNASDRIVLAPLKFSNRQLVSAVESRLARRFPGRVSVIDFDMDVDEALSRERGQYYSTKLVARAIPLCESVEGRIVLLVDFDLYVPVFTFVFGEAMLNGRFSIVSLCRLHEEFYSGSTDDELLLDRAMKEILHELGHNFGLYHCQNWDCVMHASAGVEEVDVKGSNYCSQCLRELRGRGINA